MNEESEQVLKDELRQLEAETFEIEDIIDLATELADWCSSSCSTSRSVLHNSKPLHMGVA